MPNRQHFEKELEKQLVKAKSQGREYKIIISGDLHRAVGEYPGSNHNMPGCCAVMRNRMGENDEIMKQPSKGNGATLEIKYVL